MYLLTVLDSNNKVGRQFKYLPTSLMLLVRTTSVMLCYKLPHQNNTDASASQLPTPGSPAMSVGDPVIISTRKI